MTMTERQPPSRRDPVVDRVNELTTTMLDTIALLAVAGGLVLILRPALGWGVGLFFGGCLLAALSFVTQVMHRDRPPKPRPAVPVLPGPSDPGTLHVAGR